MTERRAMMTFRYRIYPTVVQTREMERQLDEACRLYNAALQERRDAWRMQRKSISFYDQCKQLTEIRAAGDIGIPSTVVARYVLLRADHAFKAFFRRAGTGSKPGYPRFKSSHSYDSLTFAASQGTRAWLHTGRLNLLGIGDVKINLHRPFGPRVRTVTVRRSAGRWYACVTCDAVPEKIAASPEAVGVDVGLATFATLSTGGGFANPRHFHGGRRALRVAQRRAQRRQPRSNGKRSAALLLQRIHERIRNQRRDFHHKTARQLVNRFGLIAVEALNVKGLARGHSARAVHDAGWGDFLRILSDKAANAGRTLIAVNPAGTSQQCSGCGQTVPKTLKDRIHACPDCGLVLNRDHNAALNILRAGMAQVGGTWPEVRASVPAGADA